METTTVALPREPIHIFIWISDEVIEKIKKEKR